MNFKKAIPRRAFLQGAGAAVALPLLDSMVPAFAQAQAPKRNLRLSIFYVPNGIIMGKWTPAAVGSDFEITPTLEPLSAFRENLFVLSGLAQNQGHSLPGETSGDHPRASASYLTCVHPRPTNGRELHVGTSMDQIVAAALGGDTQLASLELGIESADVLGTNEPGYSGAYYNTISWKNPSTPLPMENNPRVVFERLFGDRDSTDRGEVVARIQEERSVLDFVSEGASRLMKDVGPTDRAKLTQYLDAVRDVERRIQLAEEQASRELPIVQRPVSVPGTFTEHIKLLIDLQVLAYQSDLTRVSTLMVGHEMGLQAYPELGFADPYHPLTHHNGDPEKVAKVIQIDTLHTQIYAYFLEKLQSTPDGDGSLLDHSINLYGSGLSDGNVHAHDDLPLLLACGKESQIKGGRHLRYSTSTPMANLYLTLLDKLGVPVDKLGDSTGKLELLSV